MVRVPEYQQDQRLRPIFQQGVDVRATPDAFGADVGRGMQQLAQGGLQMADAVQRVQDLQASLAAKDSLTAFEREKMELDYGPNGYLTTQGRNAVEGRAGYNEALEALKKKHAPKNPLAAQKYGDASTAAVTQGMRTGIIHSAQGQKDWAASASTARMELFKDQALAGYDKPAEIGRALALGNAEIDQQAGLMGWDSSVVEVKKKEFSSQVHTNVALAMASRPNGARAAMDYVKKNSDAFDPKTKLEIETKLKPFADDEEGLSVVNEIMTQGRKPPKAPDDPVGEVLAAGRPQTGGGPTRSKAFLMARSAHKDRPGDTTNLDNDFADNLAALIQDAPPEIRAGLGLGSGWRSNERQKELFENSDKTGRMVAFPAGYTKPNGTIAKGSNHLHGRAVDLTFNGMRLDKAPANVREWVHQNAGNYGLRFPMSWEPWHIEPIGRGSTVTAARDGVAARSTMPSYGEAIERINQISDPQVRASAIKQLNAQYEMRSKAESMDAAAAKSQIWSMVLQNVPMSQIPLDLKVAAGREAVVGFQEYEAKAGNVTTNPVAYSKLNELAAVNPSEFAKLDLTAPEIINNFSREDWKALENKRNAILGDTRKANEEGAVFQQAYKVAEEFYSAAGIVTGNSREAQDEANRLREMRLRDAMRQETMQFMAANNGKKPGYEELRAMAAMLTMQAIASEKRTNPITTFFDSDGLDDVWEGPRFMRQDAPGGSELRFKADFKTIPAEWVSTITVALTQRNNGVPPTKAQIEEEWAKIAAEVIGTD